MLFKPSNLGCGKTRRYSISNSVDSSFKTTELSGDGITFDGGGGVTPQLGGTNNLTVFIQRHKAMLLATNPDSLYFRGICLGFLQSSLNRVGRSFFPCFRILFLGTGRQTFD